MAKNDQHLTGRKGFRSRKENNREERKTGVEEASKILFSFKDFDCAQVPPGQSYKDWQKEELLAYMLEEFGHLSQWTMQQAQENKILTIYGDFPSKSDFKAPKHIDIASDVQWAVIKNVKGQKGRVAGHVIGNVFYVVFLDKNHVFWKMKK